MNFIAFPALGIHWNINPVAFSFGPFTVRWYGIMLSLAIFSALFISLRQSPKYGIKSDHMVDMFMFALPVSVIFARLFFVVVEWDSFKNDLLGAFRIWEGGITIYGAVIGAVLTVFVYTRIKKFNMWEWLDFGIVYLPIAQAIGRFGNFFNQELYGGNTTLPWGMTGNMIQAYPNPGVNGNLPVHPTFLYESLWNILVFIVLMNFRPRSKKRGQVFGAYLFLYSIGRFGMEFVRTDVFSFSGSTLRANMLVAAIIATIGIAVFVWRGFTKDSLWVALPPEEPEAVNRDGDAGTGTMKKTGKTDAQEVIEPGKSAYGNVLRALHEDNGGNMLTVEKNEEEEREEHKACNEQEEQEDQEQEVEKINTETMIKKEEALIKANHEATNAEEKAVESVILVEAEEETKEEKPHR